MFLFSTPNYMLASSYHLHDLLNVCMSPSRKIRTAKEKLKVLSGVLEEKGSFLTQCKNGAKKALTGCFRIPSLMLQSLPHSS